MPVLEDDHPRQRLSPRRGGRPRGPGVDSQTLLVRRVIALGAALLFLLILVFGVRGCLDSRKKNALKRYNREVASIVHESDKQIGQPFFELLSQPGQQSPQDLQTNISGYRVQAETALRQAKKLDVPQQMRPAQRSLLIALEYRRDGLEAVAQRIRTALGDNPDAAASAIQEIAAEMQFFLASDVTYQGRVVPLMQKALKDAGLSAVPVAKSQFLLGVEWLSADTIADKLGQQTVMRRKNRRNEPPAPGRHGTALVSVTAGSTRLLPTQANRLPAASNSFVVKFINEGDNDEFDLKVGLTIDGAGRPIHVERRIDTVAKGATAEATLQLPTPAPTGRPVTIKVNVDPVPGEKNVDNNKSEYSVLFS